MSGRATALPDEARRLVQRLGELAERALVAVEADDEERLEAALSDRDSVIERLGPLLESLRPTRDRGPDPLSGSAAAALASAVDRVREQDRRLAASLEARRRDVSSELARLKSQVAHGRSYTRGSGNSHLLDTSG